MNKFEYKNMTPFKWFVLENFPFIENDFDAINNYHLFSKVVEYLNKTIDNMNLTGEQMENVTNAMTELQNYVNNYFENLDVQDEINNKLDEMVQNGTLTNIIENYINPYIQEQNTRINNIETQVQSVANGNPIPVNSIDDMTDTSRAYLLTTDGNWYYYNGSEWVVGGSYQSTGIANNSIQYDMLENKLKNNFKASFSEVTGITWNAGGYYKNDGTIGTDTNYAYSNKISVNPYEYYLYPNNVGLYNAVCMFDSSQNFVSKIALTDVFVPFAIPTNVKYIGLSCRTRTDRPYMSNKLFKVNNYFINGQSKIMYGDMDNAFQNSFIPEYEDITSSLNFHDGFYPYNNANIISDYYNTSTSYEQTQINVLPGEKYRITCDYVANVSMYQLIGGENPIIYPSTSTPSRTTETKEITIPDGYYLLNISGYKNTIKIEKISGYTFTGSNNSNYEIEQLQNFNIEQQLKNDFKWSSNILNGKFATFTFDDLRTDIDVIEDLFESKNVPCCFAAIPNRLSITTSTSGETMQEVLERAVQNGGEVLAHWSEPLTSSSTDDDYNNVYIGAKKTLEEAGFKINGIITAGGTNYQTQNFDKDVELARNNYFYADLTGYNNHNIEQYWNRRNFLDDGVSAIETLIDNYVNNTGTQPYSKWLNFASHGTSDTSLQDIETIIDYCLSNNIQIVTWNYLYNNFKSSQLEERIKNLEN